MTLIRMGDQLLALVLAKSLGRRLDTNAERVEKHAQMSTYSPAVKSFRQPRVQVFCAWDWQLGGGDLGGRR
jgi:hypothetical protein